MKIDDLRSTTNVDDRRGRGFGRLLLGGGGLGIAVVVIAALLGVDPNEILSQLPVDGGTTQTQSGPRADDPQFEFSRKIIGSTEDVWSEIFAEQGRQYQPATFAPYDSATPTGCGFGASAMGPFYCPQDGRVYVDFAFFDELKTKYGAPGDFAQAYVLAHEIGHNVQTQLGVMDDVERQKQGLGEAAANRLSVRVELQADCYAGVWANRANKRSHILEEGDVQEGLAAASAVGDDTLEQQGQGYVVPDSFTHGTSAQRMRWFKRGLAGGDMNACDTFGADTL